MVSAYGPQCVLVCSQCYCREHLLPCQVLQNHTEAVTLYYLRTRHLINQANCAWDCRSLWWFLTLWGQINLVLFMHFHKAVWTGIVIVIYIRCNRGFTVLYGQSSSLQMVQQCLQPTGEGFYKQSFLAVKWRWHTPVSCFPRSSAMGWLFFAIPTAST